MRFTCIALIIAFFTLFSCVQEKSVIKVSELSSGFIYEKAPFAECHASTIAETDEGMMASWFGGTHEKNPDVCIYTSVLKNSTWSDPVKVADGIINDTLRYPCWNPVLFNAGKASLFLFYKIGPSPREWWGAYKVSKDQGRTWSEEVKLPEGYLGPIKNKAVRLANGKILYPTSWETPETWNIYVEMSDEKYKNLEKVEIDNNGFNAIQPTVLFHKNGDLQMLCRSKERKIVETWSKDSGKSWTPLKASALVNNNSGIDAVTLKNGVHLLVCNPIERGRNKLSLLASENGKDWEEIWVLEDETEGEFSYPAIIQAKDGTVHITYTYHRKKVKYIHLELL